jgi:uncharacterized protein
VSIASDTPEPYDVDHSDKTRPHIIDTDVHETLTSTTKLLPYIDRQWRSYITDFRFTDGFVAGGNPYAYRGGNRMDWSRDFGPASESVEALRQHLFVEEKESLVILNGFFHVASIKAEYEFAAALASAYNDWQIAEWLDKEPRLRGSIHVTDHDPGAAVREIDRLGDHPQMVQVFLPTVTDRQYGEPHFHSIYEAARRHNLSVAFHHGSATQTVLGYSRYYAEWHVLAPPQAAMGQLTSLVCNGVLDKFDDLKFIFLECSLGWLPWAMRRLDQNIKECAPEVPWVKRLPSDSIRACVRMSTQPMGDVKPSDFVRLVEDVESDELFMFSSDYPHYDADGAVQTFPAAIGRQLQQAVLSGNAIKAYPRLEAVQL